jgi:hypothetical protein
MLEIITTSIFIASVAPKALKKGILLTGLALIWDKIF